MSDDIVIDTTTGLPVLPDGYFFEVKRDKISSDSYRVPGYRLSVRRKKRIGSDTIISQIIEDENREDVLWLSALTEEVILKTATLLIPRFDRKMLNAKLADKHERLVGKYPPNSIGQ